MLFEAIRRHNTVLEGWASKPCSSLEMYDLCQQAQNESRCARRIRFLPAGLDVPEYSSIFSSLSLPALAAQFFSLQNPAVLLARLANSTMALNLSLEQVPLKQERDRRSTVRSVLSGCRSRDI